MKDEQTTMISIREIDVTEETQTRVEIDHPTVGDYAASMEEAEGYHFPPVVAFWDESEGTYFLGDGWHRVFAAQAAGLSEVPAIVAPGGRGEALRYALKANANHGLPRTNADKRKCVRKALELAPEASDRGIAEMTAVSRAFVGKVRRELEAAGEIETTTSRIGRDGVEQPRTPPTPAAAGAAEPAGDEDRDAGEDPAPPEGRPADLTPEESLEALSGDGSRWALVDDLIPEALRREGLDPVPTWRELLDGLDIVFRWAVDPDDPKNGRTEAVETQLALDAIAAIKGRDFYLAHFRPRAISVEHAERKEAAELRKRRETEAAAALERLHGGIQEMTRRSLFDMRADVRGRLYCRQIRAAILVLVPHLPTASVAFVGKVHGYGRAPDWQDVTERMGESPSALAALLFDLLLASSAVQLGAENAHFDLVKSLIADAVEEESWD